MEIKFEMRDKTGKIVRGKSVNILIKNDNKSEFRETGQIFTPASSGHDTLNAIQICGFTEAFDLWGCAIYQEPATDDTGTLYVYEKYPIAEGFELKTKQRKRMIQVKDIQLEFGMETKAGHATSISFRDDDCLGCFNKPCTCERKDRFGNPYTVKRASDLSLIMTKERKGIKPNR